MARQANATGSVVVPYETRLDNDPRWTLWEVSRHFEERSLVFKTLRKITTRLNDLGVPYAVAGDIALFRHGLRRYTEFVEIVVGKGSLIGIQTELLGTAYVLAEISNTSGRDAISGVRVAFFTAGDILHSVQGTPIMVPQPSAACLDAGGIHYLKLSNLVEPKLASGMADASRMKDLADVLELIKVLNLPSAFSMQLCPYIREQFAALWRDAHLSGADAYEV
jgi:hypothetical protein